MSASSSSNRTRADIYSGVGISYLTCCGVFCRKDYYVALRGNDQLKHLTNLKIVLCCL